MNNPLPPIDELTIHHSSKVVGRCYMTYHDVDCPMTGKLQNENMCNMCKFCRIMNADTISCGYRRDMFRANAVPMITCDP